MIAFILLLSDLECTMGAIVVEIFVYLNAIDLWIRIWNNCVVFPVF